MDRCDNQPAGAWNTDRVLATVNWFWLAVIAALFLVAGATLYGQHPERILSVDGALTIGLALANAAWFASLMLMRSIWRSRLWEVAPWRRYGLVAIGVVLTVSLVLLHDTFASLLFAGIGMSIFAVNGWGSLIPVAVYLGVFGYESGIARTADVADQFGNLVSVVSVIAIVYSLAALIRQRAARDRLIEELRAAQQELRRVHAQELELAALRERNRLAREMHDSIGHALVLIAMKIEAGQRLQTRDPRQATEEWENTKSLVRSTMADLRNSIAGLRLPALEEQPLPEALADLAAGMQNGDLAIDVAVPEDAAALDRPRQEAVYRVVQESLANVTKHARANRAWVTIDLDGSFTRVEIADDGIGLAAAPRGGGRHYGVTGMIERVEALGGTLTLAPRDGGGTVVRALLPLEEPVDVRHPHPVG